MRNCCACIHLSNARLALASLLPSPPPSLPPSLPTSVLEPRRWLSLGAPNALMICKRPPVPGVEDAGEGGGEGGGGGGRV